MTQPITSDEALRAVEALDKWIFARCPGGPWRGIEHVSVLKQYFTQTQQQASAHAPEAADQALHGRLNASRKNPTR